MNAFLPAVFLVVLLSACATKPKPPPELEIKYDDHGNPLGCNWYCGAPPIEVTASSSLTEGGVTYSAENAHDTKKSTVWVEGADGLGIGESITFTFDMTDRKPEPDPDYKFGIDGVSIINGFAADKSIWEKNGRVKVLEVAFNGKPLGTITLEDTPEPQFLKLPKIVFRPGKREKVTFTIREVYPGSKYQDTAIADFFFSGFGVH